MIKERICFAALFAVEAVIIWFYYKSIYQSKRTGLILLASFTVGYVFLFFLSELKIPALNLLLFMLVNFILIISNYKCSLTAAVLHAAFLTFCNAVAEVLVNLGLMSFGVEYNSYTQNFRVLGINFLYNIVSSNFSFMDAASITALFSNLLSNAVEAAQNSSRKQIELSIKRNLEEEFILISLSNSCDIAPILDNAGLFISTKNNHELHGYGQRSIERVIRKYDGLSALRYDADNSTFNYTIRLPYENLAGNC